MNEQSRLWWKKSAFTSFFFRATRTAGVRLRKRTGLSTSFTKHTNFEDYFWALLPTVSCCRHLLGQDTHPQNARVVGGIQKQKWRGQAGSDFEYLLTIRNRVERNGSPWRKSNLGSHAPSAAHAQTACSLKGQPWAVRDTDLSLGCPLNAQCGFLSKS